MTELDIFCRNFSYLRIISGLTQKEMAEKLGVSVYSVKTIEHGRVPGTVRAKILLAIFISFGVSPSDMFVDDKERILEQYQLKHRMLH